MPGRRHRYEVAVAWTGNDGSGTSGYRAYRRDHEIAAPGKPSIAGSSDPAFRGDPARWNPEDLLVASLSSCHMLWYLHLCAVAGIVVTAYRDDAEGVMEEGADGGGRFTQVTLRPAVTVQYPHVKPDLPARTRGVIALKQENCTVCYKCSRECPDWCIYIDAHKESHEPAGGGRARSVKVLDRFAIDYALCMYCGICVEVCPFDALFWSPEFEYGEYRIDLMTHEKERLEEWTYKVLPPPPLEEGAEPLEPPAEVATVGAGEVV